jgi:hypothetical protein
MKHLISYSVSLFFSTIIISIPALKAQDTIRNKKDDVATIIEKKIAYKNFSFVAESEKPVSSGTIQLTDDYRFTIKGDSLSADLPYVGRSFSAANASNTSVDFTTTEFQYGLAKRKKNGWDVQIIPKDQTDYQSFSLIVFNTGFATLNIYCTTREAISYTGHIEQEK